MKKLLLITLLCVNFLSAENNASGYPKHWTAEDIKFYDEREEVGFLDIDEEIEGCNRGMSLSHSLHICQYLKSYKQAMLYLEAKNKNKFTQSFKESCYWLMRMGKHEIQILPAFAFYDEEGNIKEILGVPSEVQMILKGCAKIK